LKTTLEKTGRLTPAIINGTVGLPAAHTYMDHFGTLRNAYRLVGYKSPRHCEYLDLRQSWMEPLSQLFNSICEALRKAGRQTSLCDDRSKRIKEDFPTHHLIVDGACHVFLRVAYWSPGRRGSFSPFWSVPCRRLSAGWIVAIRLDEHNQSVLDYVVLPTVNNHSNLIRFREKGHVDHGVQYYGTEIELARAVTRLKTNGKRASQTKSRSRSREETPARSRKRSAGARRR
jgi:hypothetical protein